MRVDESHSHINAPTRSTIPSYTVITSPAPNSCPANKPFPACALGVDSLRKTPLPSTDERRTACTPSTRLRRTPPSALRNGCTAPELSLARYAVAPNTSPHGRWAPTAVAPVGRRPPPGPQGRGCMVAAAMHATTADEPPPPRPTHGRRQHPRGDRPAPTRWRCPTPTFCGGTASPPC